MRRSMMATLIGVATLGLYAAPAREAYAPDPPRRRKHKVIQSEAVLLPRAEPEVLSKRAKRRARGKAKGRKHG